MFDNWEQERVISLAELAGMIEGVISTTFDRGFWVKAEMARLNLYPESGHCYPDLVEKEGRNVKAQMRGTIWAGNYQRIAKRFIEIAREPLKDGIQILFFATVKFHPQYGLSLQISDIDPTFTLGQMARDRLETIRRLQQDGIFDNNRNLPMPLLPKSIAVISVETSKGYSDFLRILESLSHRYHFEITLYPALLQGDKAVESIRGQLKTIKKHAPAFDAVAIIRGGGGEIGLSCYDVFDLAKEVANFPLPVITGIGHSTNETVVEMVAAQNKITPTDVAYYIVEKFAGFEAKLNEIYTFLSEFAHDILDRENETIRDLVQRLEEETLVHIDSHRSRIDSMVKNTLQQTRLRLRTEKEKLATSTAVILISPKRSLQHEAEELKHKLNQFTSMLKNTAERQKHRLHLAESRIRLMDPMNTLKRGFSITLHNGKLLNNADGVMPGDVITTKLLKGKIISTVQSKQK
jgi:exodeoxyribonuclease VII large subunit